MIYENNWYPWLDYSYKKIVNFYKKKIGSQVFLLFSKLGIGGNYLICAIIKYLMCKKLIGIKSCNNCTDCKLILSNSHPDLHIIHVENEKKIGIEKIRFLSDFLINYAHQDGFKIIWINSIEKLTEEASNSLLKLLEEYNDCTYFFLECNNLMFLNLKIKSRCFFYSLNHPKKEEIYDWLEEKDMDHSKKNIETAIRVSMEVPIDSFLLLKNKNWILRKNFYIFLEECLFSRDMLDFLSELNKLDVINRINWLITFFLDSLKYKINIDKYFVNLDQLHLIKKVSNFFSDDFLLKSIFNWQICRYNLIFVAGLNKECYLISKLIDWKKILLKTKFFN